MTYRKKTTVTQASNDGRSFALKSHPGEVKTGDTKPSYLDEAVAPHNRESEVTTSILQQKLSCPACGNSTIHAEFPDQYECWIKCSDCRFFMGMSYADWHSMENSPNLNEKIKKMANRKGLVLVS
jgi:ribosomal protein S27AE